MKDQKKRIAGILEKPWRYVMITFMISILSAATIEYVITPYVIPPMKRLFFPTGSFYVSVKYVEAPEVEVDGGELSRLLLIKQTGELVEEVNPKEGWYKWDNVSLGRYVVKAYVNDMYAGKTEFEIHRAENKSEEIVTEIARSMIIITVVSDEGPVEDAWVEILSYRGLQWRGYRTDATGETPKTWLYRTTEEHEYYSIYVYPAETSEKLESGSVDRFEVDEGRVLYTIRLPSKH